MIRKPLPIDPSILFAWGIVSADSENKKQILKTRMESLEEELSQIDAEENENVPTEKSGSLGDNSRSKNSITDLLSKFENEPVKNKKSTKKIGKRVRCPERSRTVIGIGNSLLLKRPINQRTRRNSHSLPDVNELEPKLSVKDLLKRFEEGSAYLVKAVKNVSVPEKNVSDLEETTVPLLSSKNVYITPSSCSQESQAAIDEGDVTADVTDEGSELVATADVTDEGSEIVATDVATDEGSEIVATADVTNTVDSIISDNETTDIVADEDPIMYKATVVVSEHNMFPELGIIKDVVPDIENKADASKGIESVFGESEKNETFPFITKTSNFEVDSIETKSVSVKNMLKKFENMSNSNLNINVLEEREKERKLSILHTPYFSVERKLSTSLPITQTCTAAVDILPDINCTEDFENSINLSHSPSGMNEFENEPEDVIHLTTSEAENMNETDNDIIISDYDNTDIHDCSILPPETVKEDFDMECKSEHNTNIEPVNTPNVSHIIKEFSRVNNCQKYDKKFAGEVSHLKFSKTDDINESNRNGFLEQNIVNSTHEEDSKLISPLPNDRTKLFGESVSPKIRTLKEDEENYFKNNNNSFPKIENKLLSSVQHEDPTSNYKVHNDDSTETLVRSSSLRLPKNCRALKEEERKFFTLGNATDIFFKRRNSDSSKISKDIDNINSSKNVNLAECELSIIRSYDANAACDYINAEKESDNVEEEPCFVEKEFDNVEEEVCSVGEEFGYVDEGVRNVGEEFNNVAEEFNEVFEDSSLHTVASIPVVILNDTSENSPLQMVASSPKDILDKDSSPNTNFSPISSPTFEITYSENSIDIDMENTLENMNSLDQSFDQLFDESGLDIDDKNKFYWEETLPLSSTALVKNINSIYADAQDFSTCNELSIYADAHDSSTNNEHADVHDSGTNNEHADVHDSSTSYERSDSLNEDLNIKPHHHDSADISITVDSSSNNNDLLNLDTYEIDSSNLCEEIDSKIKLPEENIDQCVENSRILDEDLNIEPLHDNISKLSMTVDSSANNNENLNPDVQENGSPIVIVELDSKIKFPEENFVASFENCHILDEDLNTEPPHDNISNLTMTVDSSATNNENLNTDVQENVSPIVNVEIESKIKFPEENIVAGFENCHILEEDLNIEDLNFENSQILDEDLYIEDSNICTKSLHDNISNSSITVESPATDNEDLNPDVQKNESPIVNVEIDSKINWSEENVASESEKYFLEKRNDLVVEPTNSCPPDEESPLVFVDTVEHSCVDNTVMDKTLNSNEKSKPINLRSPRKVTGQVNRTINFFQKEMHEQVQPDYKERKYCEYDSVGKSDSVELDKIVSKSMNTCPLSNGEEAPITKLTKEVTISDLYCPNKTNIDPIPWTSEPSAPSTSGVNEHFPEPVNEIVEDQTNISIKSQISPQENAEILRKRINESIKGIKEIHDMVHCHVDENRNKNRFFDVGLPRAVGILLLLMLVAYFFSFIRA